ncbi:MAG TPA: 50S ribosomal protein L29 [Vicinamibacterales bacterium]|nr:50S ribosomal protein L29 [Vicinamibacterales bacterium]
MKATELRELAADDLQDKVAEIEDEVFRLRIRKSMGQLEKPTIIRDARRNLARVKTILREKAK